jgi:hypothetical protein
MFIFILIAGKDDDEEYPAVQRTLLQCKGPRQTQEQLNLRIADISSRVEPLNTRFAEFLSRYSTAEMVANHTWTPAS